MYKMHVNNIPHTAHEIIIRKLDWGSIVQVSRAGFPDLSRAAARETARWDTVIKSAVSNLEKFVRGISKITYGPDEPVRALYARILAVARRYTVPITFANKTGETHASLNKINATWTGSRKMIPYCVCRARAGPYDLILVISCAHGSVYVSRVEFSGLGYEVHWEWEHIENTSTFSFSDMVARVPDRWWSFDRAWHAWDIAKIETLFGRRPVPHGHHHR